MSFWGELANTMTEWIVGDGWVALAQGVAAAVVVYLVALVITRTGKKRYLGRNTVFDLLLAFILGSVLSRAINGSASLAMTAAAGFVLIGMHFLFGEIAVRTENFGNLIKGKPEAVVKDGQVLKDALHDHHLTEGDLEEAARQDGLSSIDGIQDAYFERNGRLSIIQKGQVRVVEVDVKDGVQTVRIEF